MSAEAKPPHARKIQRMISGIAFTAVITVCLFSSRSRAADAPEKSRKLVAILQSDSSFFEKARACQQLGEIGDADAILALTALLTDERLSAYARSGLEGIPDPRAAAALRAAVNTVKGAQQAGVVNSLGVLRDSQAVGLLSKLAADPESGVVKEALLALGNICTGESVAIVERALKKGPETSRAAAAAACLLAADRNRVEGRLAKALALYGSMLRANVPLAYRVGATRGSILAHGSDRVRYLLRQLRSEEPAIRNAALLTVRDVPDKTLATDLSAALKGAKPELQILLLLALVDCQNPRPLAGVQNATSSPDPEVRKTALLVLGKLGPGAAPTLLAALDQERPAEERSIACEGLAEMEGNAVDDLILTDLASAKQSRTRIDLIRLLSRRGVVRASPEILKQAKGMDTSIRLAALSALSSLATPGDLPVLVGLVKNCEDEAVREAAENAVAANCARKRDSNAGPEAVLGELKQATRAVDRISWIRILATLGYTNALPVIARATTDPDQTVAENAVAQLGRWPDSAPIELLLNMMESGATPGLRNRALVSVIELANTAADEGRPSQEVVAGWLRRADGVARSIEEKRRILSVSGRLKTQESFTLMAPYLNDPNLRTEAAAGLVQIAPALVKGEDARALKTSLERIAFTVPNASLREQASQLAKTIPGQSALVNLFDGRSLAGWEGDTNVWRVQEGVIMGGSMKGNPRNEFLATVRSYTNFVLELEYKLVGSEGFINSGVQFRSVRVSDPPNEMNGYQADIGAGHSGCLYDESRRNRFLARPSDPTIKRLETPGDWNRYKLSCQGTRIQIWLNGEQTVDYTEAEPGIPQAGLLGLQIHGGNKAEVSFRKILLEDL